MPALIERTAVRVLVMLVLLAGTLASIPSAGGRQVADQTFGAGTSLVYVDVYPRRAGRIVENLRAEDFDVFENGRRQTIELVEFVRFDVNPVDADRRDPVSVADSARQALDPRSRAFVITRARVACASRLIERSRRLRRGSRHRPSGSKRIDCRAGPADGSGHCVRV
jgi:hypothetical protein